MRNVFVIGLDPFNNMLMRQMPGAEDCRFHAALEYSEAVRPKTRDIDLEALVALGDKRLRDFDGEVDGIIWYWDFPSSTIGPILAERHGLPGPRLEAVAACEHKYWSRVAQKECVPDMVPDFSAVDPFAENPLAQVEIDFPFWLKPVKAHSSFLGFKIRSRRDFEEALPVIRHGIGIFGRPMEQFLSRLDPPPQVSDVGGHQCIAEELISAGSQCTLEGWARRGEVVVYGVIDSMREGRHRSSFSRYQYPSQLPRRVQARMVDAATRLVRHIDYEDAPFNVEFFWDRKTDEIRLLEINARISKSHSPLFHMVDGSAHQKVSTDLATGRRPDFPRREGRYKIAAKFMLRVFEDGIVRGVPTEEDIARVRRDFPDTFVNLLVEEGQRLAHLPFQDSYSFELADVFLGSEDQRLLLEKFRMVRERLPFDIETTETEVA